MRAIHAIPLLALASCGPKTPTEAPAKVGWHGGANAEGVAWAGQCYYPPNYDTLDVSARKMARAKALEDMRKQWAGQREDGVAIDEMVIDVAETALLGRPEWIEQASVDNVAHCETFMTGGGQGSWQSWLRALPNKVNEGECPYLSSPYRPENTLFDYLDIGNGWQIKVFVCRGERYRIEATGIDLYRIKDKGPWINSEGDKSQPTITGDWPCTRDGCYAGQVIMRFTGDSGFSEVHPVGTGADFVATEHGYVQVAINDDTYYDNVFKTEAGMQYHTGITFKPSGN